MWLVDVLEEFNSLEDLSPVAANERVEEGSAMPSSLKGTNAARQRDVKID